MRYLGFSLGSPNRLIVALPLALGLAMTVSQCADVQGTPGPRIIPEDLQENLCVTEDKALLLSEVLAGTQTLTSDLSASDCSGSENGYFETWHVYADQTETVVVVAEADFDNLMRLVRLEDIQQTPNGYDVEVRIIDENDDQDAGDSRARVAATLHEGEDYLLVLSGFNEDETGPYELEVSPTPSLPPAPATGSVNVNVASSGVPPDSYTITLNGLKAKPVAANGTSTYTGIVAGDHAVELSGLGNCTVDADNPLNVVVRADQNTAADFELSCPECVTGDDCPQGGVCAVTVCAEGGSCDTQTVEDGAPCDHNGGPGQCTGGVCGATTCNPVCTDDDLNDCTEPFCPAASTLCDTRVRPLGSDCQRNDKDGKCDGLGTCDICVRIDCTTTNQCQEDSTCNSSTGTCYPFNAKPVNTPCTPDGNVCDGNGNCVECTSAGQCPDDVSECTAAACDAGQCGQDNLVDGAPCDFNGGDGICETGVCIEAPECPPPCDDMNVCTSDQCVVGTCSFTPLDGGACQVSTGVPGTCGAGACIGLCVGKNCASTKHCQLDSTCNLSTGNCDPFANKPAGTSCDQDGGSVCDGNGSCVGCNSAADCPDDVNDCTAAACIGFACGQSNVPDGTLCDGSAGRCQAGNCEALRALLGDKDGFGRGLQEGDIHPASDGFFDSRGTSDPPFTDVLPAGYDEVIYTHTFVPPGRFETGRVLKMLTLGIGDGDDQVSGSDTDIRLFLDNVEVPGAFDHVDQFDFFAGFGWAATVGLVIIDIPSSHDSLLTDGRVTVRLEVHQLGTSQSLDAFAIDYSEIDFFGEF